MAIAANQIGVLKRVFVAEADDTVWMLVNPVVEGRSSSSSAFLRSARSITEVIWIWLLW
jgi:peptide deformylase